jgi:DNA repair exonuclease SbcCD ATPase subunit
VQNQEGELEKLRQELQRLREEEQGLEQQVESSRQQLSQLTTSNKDIATQVSQVRTFSKLGFTSTLCHSNVPGQDILKASVHIHTFSHLFVIISFKKISQSVSQ